MYSKVYSGGIHGIDGFPVEIEADVSEGLPQFVMTGYLSSQVREAQDRVRSAIRNSDFRLMSKKITVNLAPANIRKAGTGYDLAIAVSLLTAYGYVTPEVLQSAAFIGELGLNGEIRGVRGILSIVSALRDAGFKRCYLSPENYQEGCVIENIEMIRASDLSHLVHILNNPGEHLDQFLPVPECSAELVYDVDFADVAGQQSVKRACEVAVAGQHNLLIVGQAGSGKSMIAKRIPTIMPELTKEENLEISKIYSVCGLIEEGRALLGKRPFRSPHHTISPQALVGGGNFLRPGEISLADRGVLFLDELPEFQQKVIEALRQPLEDHHVSIARVNGNYAFPANIMLVAAMNPCNCGYYPDRSRCNCSIDQVHKYLGKISRPMLDRFDIGIEAAPVMFEDITQSSPGESSAVIRERVEAARQIQLIRFRDRSIFFNSEMNRNDIQAFCRTDRKSELYLQKIFNSRKISARAYHKILKVSRTIADLEGKDSIEMKHIAEAVSYRSLEEKFWKGC